jgi:ParB-like chromosome segregation protein Spo0J
VDLFTGSAQDVFSGIRSALAGIKDMDLADKIDVINMVKRELHELSPFKGEPVDCVLWVPADSVQANDYNPNSVAPPEMKLLEHSITEDGYTQPIVAWKNDAKFEVVDGFHRNRVGKESKKVRQRVHGYLPVTIINDTRLDLGDRMSSTIRHNRARGKHKVEAMSDIVVELKRRNWTDERICRDLGMDQDEVLRLCQITGLQELFADQSFSKSWDAEGEVTEADFKELTDDVTTYGEEAEDFRTVNTSDEERIFHTYGKWECYKAGFYKNTVEGKTKQECEEAYREFLSDTKRFKKALKRVITEWKHSCEHYLSNAAMNRIAWLGQASMCIATGIPAAFRGGFALLTEAQQKTANETALIYLNKWLKANDRKTLTLDEAMSDRQSDIY